MVTRDHTEWRRRVLGYEEMEPEEKSAVDAHLSTCPACAALLARLQAVERELGEASSLPEGPHSLFGQDASTQEAARASLEALRSRLDARQGLGSPAALPPRRTSFPAGLRLSWGLAVVAAAAVVLVSIRRMEERTPLLSNPAIVAASSVRGAAPALPGVFHTGDSFAIRFELSRPAVPIVFHTDPAGNTELLCPETSEAPLAIGQHTLPDDSLSTRWSFEGDPGRETFFLAVGSEQPASLEVLVQEVTAIERGSSDRETRIREVRRLLEKRIGKVRVLEVEHRP